MDRESFFNKNFPLSNTGGIPVSASGKQHYSIISIEANEDDVVSEEKTDDVSTDEPTEDSTIDENPEGSSDEDDGETTGEEPVEDPSSEPEEEPEEETDPPVDDTSGEEPTDDGFSDDTDDGETPTDSETSTQDEPATEEEAELNEITAQQLMFKKFNTLYENMGETISKLEEVDVLDQKSIDAILELKELHTETYELIRRSNIRKYTKNLFHYTITVRGFAEILNRINQEKETNI